MVDINEEKTVVVDRGAADRSSPAGWIAVAVVLLLIVLFFMFGGMQMFNGNGTSTGGNGTSTGGSETTAPAEPSTTAPTANPVE